MLVSCHKIRDANKIRRREKRQFSGGSFAVISVPFFNLAWGNVHSLWNYGYGYGNYGYGYGAPWYGPRFMPRRRYWRRRYEEDGFHESYGGHEFYDGFGGPPFR